MKGRKATEYECRARCGDAQEESENFQDEQELGVVE